MKKLIVIIIATLAIGIIGSAVFYACKKEEVKNNEQEVITLQQKAMGGDTIYIPGDCDGCTKIPDCNIKGAGCLPEVVISAPRLINEMSYILTNMVNMSPIENRDKIIAHQDLFKEILYSQWYNMILDGRLTVTVRKKASNHDGLFILDAMYIKHNKDIIPANASLPIRLVR
jgi:hypothetical protein